jgi:uncharacterized protein
MNGKRVFAALFICVLLLAASAGCVDQLVAQPSPTPLPLATTNPPITGNGSAHMLAVRQLDNGRSEGTVADVTVRMEPGSGHVFFETAPIAGVGFQNAARVAINVAAQRVRIDPTQQDFHFVVRAPAGVTEVDGPSAGLSIAAAVYAAMTKQTTNSAVYGTGAIDYAGTVSAVGGIYSKALAAVQSGAKVIIVPQNETIVTVSSSLGASSIGGVDLQSQLRTDGYDVKVIGVTSVDQALPYYFS